MDFTRIFDILQFQMDKYPNEKAVNSMGKKVWEHSSIEDVIKGVQLFSNWLKSLNYPVGSRIAFIPETGNAEWMIFDFACQINQLITVPIHQSIDKNRLRFILNETEAKLCISATLSHFHLIDQIRQEDKLNINLFHTDTKSQFYLPPIIKIRKKDYPQELPNFSALDINPEQIATIIYTSGTTGDPKGVMLTHNNIISNIKSIMALLPINNIHRTISFLPSSHIFERVACFTYLAMGVSIYFGGNKQNLTKEFYTSRPHFCTAVPRLLEKTYDAVLSQQLSKNIVKKHLSKWIINIGKKYGKPKSASSFYSLQLWLARNTVFRFWNNRMGGKIKWIVVGSAALRPEIARFFNAMKIKVREGYGMTETSPVISFNRFDPGMNKYGSVGVAIPGVQIKLINKNDANEGEILVKGPNIMKGYYKSESATSKITDKDGWLRTGDIGHLDEDHFLFITDRLKDIFKTSSGKYIAPQKLQKHFESTPFIQQCLYVGFNRPFPIALLVPNFELLKKWANQEGIHWTSPQYMNHNIRIKERIDEAIQYLNAQLPNHKRIKEYHLCHEEWTVDEGAYSSSLKLVRPYLLDKFSEEINKMYPSYVE